MASRGAEDANKLLRTDCSNASGAGFCQGLIRQLNGCGLYQPSEWHSIPATSAVGESLGCSAGHCAVSSTYSNQVVNAESRVTGGCLD